MLARRYRLRRNKDFQSVYQRGKSYGGKFVVLYRLQHRSPSPSLSKMKLSRRFGFSVSSKVGKATVRNKIKRIFREICRRHKTQLLDGSDIILIARSKIKGIPFRLVEEDVIKLFKRAKLWTGG
ncbi:ribonuclease P protein component [Heliobacterium chlorum]|uniref:Ribonuclease P protein component n=1 Tax=Heliobacterium chlorum TaxID=2698 RepID=A0ABR7T3T4_HELCL|nr:ribonuclease P protein component [Heliobacterium chlorum]MBC9785420.1 ribonuclease P protein component [Heliobacterium chlorum]